MLAIPSSDGWAVVPKLPVREWGRANKRMREVGGVKGARSAWPGSDRAGAEAYAGACTDATGIEWTVTECIY